MLEQILPIINSLWPLVAIPVLGWFSKKYIQPLVDAKLFEAVGKALDEVTDYYREKYPDKVHRYITACSGWQCKQVSNECSLPDCRLISVKNLVPYAIFRRARFVAFPGPYRHSGQFGKVNRLSIA